jgi:hypothetical protein
MEIVVVVALKMDNGSAIQKIEENASEAQLGGLYEGCLIYPSSIPENGKRDLRIGPFTLNKLSIPPGQEAFKGKVSHWPFAFPITNRNVYVRSIDSIKASHAAPCRRTDSDG